MSLPRGFRLALIVALILRVAWSLLVPVIPVSDSAAYVVFANNLIDHGVFGFVPEEPFAFWPPGTAFVYAGVFAVGAGLAGAVLLNIAMTMAIMWSAARVATRLYSPLVGLATAWVIALWPTLIIYVTIVASELPFVLLITLALDAWTSRQRKSQALALLAGALLGAAALVRPLALVLPMVFVAAELFAALCARKGFILPLSRLAAAMLAMFIVILPWTLRNDRLYDRPVLISTNGGITFWMGNTPGTKGGYMDIPAELSHLSDADIETELRARAWQYIRAEPAEFVIRTLRKAVSLYATETIAVAWNEPGIEERFGRQVLMPLKIVMQVGWMLIALLGLVGLWQLLRTGAWLATLLSPPLLAIAAFTAIHAITASQDRYHLGFFSLLAMLAANGVIALGQMRAARSQGAAT